MKTLLVAVDFSSATDPVIDQASGLAIELDARIWLLHVAPQASQALGYDPAQYADFSPDFLSMPGDVQIARDLSAEELKREHAELHEISSKMRTRNIDAHAILLKGDAGQVIVQKAADLGADIIILGSHGHGMLHKAFLGSVSEKVIRHTSCNVMIVPTPEAQS